MTNQLQEGYISPRLQELCGYYSNRLSYEEVAVLVERVSGERLLSDQNVGQIVSAKSLKISQDIYKSMAATLAENEHDALTVNAKVDIYNPEEKEILFFDDGIQVKSQKAERQPKSKPENKSQKLLEQKTPAITTDLVILQKATTGFEYI
jgi:hypothetical protein